MFISCILFNPKYFDKLDLNVNIDITDKSIAVLFGSTSVFCASQSVVKLKNILLKKEMVKMISPYLKKLLQITQ